MIPHDHVNAKGEPHCAVALAGGATYPEAAAAGGVALATIRRRMADGAYRAHVQELRGQLLEQALGVLSTNCAAASTCLVDLMHSSSDLVAQKAARSVIEMALRVRRESDLEQRMAMIETQIERAKRERDRGHGR